MSTIQITVRLPDDLVEFIDRFDKSRAAVVTDALRHLQDEQDLAILASTPDPFGDPETQEAMRQSAADAWSDLD